jgi:phenol 2-monooxygenase
MPVFQEVAHADRDLRILSSRALPLYRLTPPPAIDQGSEEKYEVVVIGVGLFYPSSIFVKAMYLTVFHKRQVQLVSSVRFS